MKHKFKIGDVVYHIVKSKYARIVDVVEESEDNHYIVSHSGWLWSVPQRGLTFKKVLKTHM